MRLPTALLLLAVSGHVAIGQRCSERSLALRQLVALSGDLLVPNIEVGGGGDGGIGCEEFDGEDSPPGRVVPICKRHATGNGLTFQDNDRCCPATTRLVPNMDNYTLDGQDWYALYTTGNGAMIQMKSTVQCNQAYYRCWFCTKRCSRAKSRVSVLVTLFDPADGVPECIPLSQVTFRQVEMETHCKCQSMYGSKLPLASLPLDELT